MASNKLADLLISAKTTLPALLLSLSVPLWMVSWLVPIRESGALLPQGVIGYWLRRFPARHLVWRVGMIVQAIAVAVILIAAIMLTGAVAGATVLSALVVLSVGRAACSLTMKDIQASVADKGTRGQLLGIASTVSGLLTLLIAVPLIYFKAQLGQVAILAIICLALLAYILAIFILFPVSAHVESETNDASAGHDSFLHVNTVVYRFIVVRGLFVHSALVAPFFMLESDTDAHTLLPYYLASQAAATLLSSFIWGKLADKSARVTLQLSGGVAVLACVGLLMMQSNSIYLSTALFFLLSVAHTGVRTGRKTYSLDIKDGQARTELVAFSNTAIGIILLAFGGFYAVIAAWLPFSVVYLMIAFLCAGVVLTLILPKEKA